MLVMSMFQKSPFYWRLTLAISHSSCWSPHKITILGTWIVYRSVMTMSMQLLLGTFSYRVVNLYYTCGVKFSAIPVPVWDHTCFLFRLSRMSLSDSLRNEILASSRKPRRCKGRVATPGPVRKILFAPPMQSQPCVKVQQWLDDCQV